MNVSCQVPEILSILTKKQWHWHLIVHLEGCMRFKTHCLQLRLTSGQYCILGITVLKSVNHANPLTLIISQLLPYFVHVNTKTEKRKPVCLVGQIDVFA